MLPFELPVCPCCTAALLHTLLQSGVFQSGLNRITAQPLIDLSRGALLMAGSGEQPGIEQLEIQQSVSEQPVAP